MDIFKNKKERVAVYMDGSNFYGYLKDKEIAFPNQRFPACNIMHSIAGR